MTKITRLSLGAQTLGANLPFIDIVLVASCQSAWEQQHLLRSFHMHMLNSIKVVLVMVCKSRSSKRKEKIKHKFSILFNIIVKYVEANPEEFFLPKEYCKGRAYVSAIVRYSYLANWY